MAHSRFEGPDGGDIYDIRLLRRLSRFVAPYKWSFLGTLLLLFGVSAAGLAGPYITKIAIDRYIQRRDMSGLSLIALLYLAAQAVEFGLRYLYLYLMEYNGQRVTKDLRMALFTHLESLSLRFYDRHPVGALMTRLIGDIGVVDEMFTSGLVSIMGDILMLAGIMGMLLYLNWRLALVMLSVVPLIAIAVAVFRQKLRDSFRLIRSRMAKINAFLQENISGMVITQVFRREQKNFAQFDQINRDYRDAYLKTISYYAIFFPVTELISALAVALVVWYGGGQVLTGALTFGALVAFIQYIERFFRPIDDLAEKYNILQSAKAAAERIFGLLDTQEYVSVYEHPKPIEHLSQGLEFREVWFAYDKEDYVLKGISFKVSKGHNVALVGHTGAGKTSIISLLLRFYQWQKGDILADGINLRELDIGQWRGRISLVLQEPFLFSGTILDNIRLGRRDITPERVEEIARQVNAHDFISRLPGGYNQVIQERGGNLSTGQRQLIAFARALAFDPEILVLDEATSSVDTETEMLIQDALARLMQGRTSLVIAHRLSTIRQADHILVLDQGRVAEEGSHQELLARRGLYNRLYQLQFGAG